MGTGTGNHIEKRDQSAIKERAPAQLDCEGLENFCALRRTLFWAPKMAAHCLRRENTQRFEMGFLLMRRGRPALDPFLNSVIVPPNSIR